MNYTEKDFSGCRLNPFQQDSVLKFIIAVYDSSSPFQRDYPVLTKRKIAAAQFAGFDMIKDDDVLIGMYSCSNPEFVAQVVEYLKEYGDSMIWAMIMSNTELFWEFNTRIMTPIKEDKDKDDVSAVNMKSKMSEELEKINERIVKLTKQFYGDEQLEEAVKKQRITPEMISQLKSN